MYKHDLERISIWLFSLQQLFIFQLQNTNEFQMAVMLLVVAFHQNKQTKFHPQGGISLLPILKNKSYDKSKETCCWSACCAAYLPQHILNFKGWKYKGCESVNLSILTRIFKAAWEFAQPVYMHFMDLEKSSDRIPRDVVWGVLWEYAVLAHYYGLFGLPSVVRAWFVLPTVNQTGSWAALYQGCPLLKSLFITLMDKISRHSQGVKGFEISGIRICCYRWCGNVGFIEWWPPTFTLVRSVWSGQDENLHGWTQPEDLGITEWAESRLGD